MAVNPIINRLTMGAIEFVAVRREAGGCLFSIYRDGKPEAYLSQTEAKVFADFVRSTPDG